MEKIDLSSQKSEIIKIRTEQEIVNLQDRLKVIVRAISGRDDLHVTTEVDEVTRANMAQQGRNAEEEWYRLAQYDRITKKITGELVHIPKQLAEIPEDVAKGIAAHEAGHVVITRSGFIPEQIMQELGFASLIAAVEERPTDQVVKKRMPGAGEWLKEARTSELKKNDGSTEDISKKLSAIPKFSQLHDLIVYEPYLEGYERPYDNEVIEIYKAISSDIEDIENTLPEEGSEEKEIVKKAKERYRKAYLKVWPRIKKLVEEDKKEEELRQMLKRTTKEKLDDLPDDPISQDLIKIFEALPDDQKQEIIKAAHKKLEDIEDEIIKKSGGKLINRPETHQEYKARVADGSELIKRTSADDLRQQRDNEARLQKEMKAIEGKQKKIDKNRSEYDKTYDEIKSFDEELFRSLEDVFSPNIKRKIKLRSSGNRISLPAVFKWESARKAGAPVVDNKIFESVYRPEKKDYAISILVDLSGSMIGGKIKETFKAVVLLSEVLNRLKINFEILGFSNDVECYKQFNENLNSDVREKVSELRKTKDLTYTGEALTKSSQNLEKIRAKEKFIIILTDGEPCGGENASEKAHRAVDYITSQTNQNIIGLGLGSGTDMVKDYFPASIPNIKTEDLVGVFGTLLKDVIVNPNKYKNIA